MIRALPVREVQFIEINAVWQMANFQEKISAFLETLFQYGPSQVVNQSEPACGKAA